MEFPDSDGAESFGKTQKSQFFFNSFSKTASLKKTKQQVKKRSGSELEEYPHPAKGEAKKLAVRLENTEEVVDYEQHKWRNLLLEPPQDQLNTFDAKSNRLKSDKLKQFLKFPSEYDNYMEAAVAAHKNMMRVEENLRLLPENHVKDRFDHDSYVILEMFKPPPRSNLKYYAKQWLMTLLYSGQGKNGRFEAHVRDVLIRKRSQREGREFRGSNLARKTAQREGLDWLMIYLKQNETKRVVT